MHNSIRPKAGGMLSPAQTIVPGTSIGGWTFQSLIQIGRLTQTWQVHSASGAPAVCKLSIPTDQSDAVASRRSITAEIQALLLLDGVVTPKVLDQFEAKGIRFLVIELIPGWNLAEIIRLYGPLQPAVAVGIGFDLAHSLARAHQVGIMHADVKPGNIILGARAYLIDFGGAGIGSLGLPSHPYLWYGTAAYASPEAIQGQQSPLSDIWSLGATLYAVVQGHSPYGRGLNPQVIVDRVANGQLEPLSADVPLLLRRVISSCLVPTASARPSAANVAAVMAQAHHC